MSELKSKSRKFLPLLLMLILLLSVLGPQTSIQAMNLEWQAKIDPELLETDPTEETEYMILLAQQANLDKAKTLSSKQEKVSYVVSKLKLTAEKNQTEIIDYLAARGIEHRTFWILS